MDREQRREAVEKIVTAAAEWGWLQAQSRRWWQPRRAQKFSMPIVMWSEDDAPAIVNGVQ